MSVDSTDLITGENLTIGNVYEISAIYMSTQDKYIIPVGSKVSIKLDTSSVYSIKYIT